jgi:hypothetical protein
VTSREICVISCRSEGLMRSLGLMMIFLHRDCGERDLHDIDIEIIVIEGGGVSVCVWLFLFCF